jgi:hypothetical protein
VELLYQLTGVRELTLRSYRQPFEDDPHNHDNWLSELVEVARSGFCETFFSRIHTMTLHLWTRADTQYREHAMERRQRTLRDFSFDFEKRRLSPLLLAFNAVTTLNIGDASFVTPQDLHNMKESANDLWMPRFTTSGSEPALLPNLQNVRIIKSCILDIELISLLATYKFSLRYLELRVGHINFWHWFLAGCPSPSPARAILHAIMDMEQNDFTVTMNCVVENSLPFVAQQYPGPDGHARDLNGSVRAQQELDLLYQLDELPNGTAFGNWLRCGRRFDVITLLNGQEPRYHMLQTCTLDSRLMPMSSEVMRLQMHPKRLQQEIDHTGCVHYCMHMGPDFDGLIIHDDLRLGATR